MTNRDLSYWKESAVLFRRRVEELKSKLKDAKGGLKYAHRKIEQIERKVLVCVVLLVIFVGGCQAVAGASRDAQWTFGKLAEMAEKAALESPQK